MAQQRVENFEPFRVWKGRLLKSKVRRNWLSRLVFLCHNRENDDLFFVYFNDNGVARYVIDLRKSHITHDVERKTFLVSTLGDDLGDDDSEDEEDDNFAERVSQVWMLRYENDDLATELCAELSRLEYPVGSVLLEGWIEKRSRRGTGVVNARGSITLLPVRKRFSLLLECGDLLYFKDEECNGLRGRVFLPSCSQIYCEDNKTASTAADAYVIVLQGVKRQLLLRITPSSDKLSVTDNFTLWMKKMVPLVLNKADARKGAKPRQRSVRKCKTLFSVYATTSFVSLVTFFYCTGPRPHQFPQAKISMTKMMALGMTSNLSLLRRPNPWRSRQPSV